MRLQDADNLFSYRSLPDIYKHQTWLPLNIHDTQQFILKHTSRDIVVGNWILLGIYLIDTKQLIGDCGFNLLSKNECEIGYTISPEYQNMGFGYEAVAAMIEYLFDELKIKKIIAKTDPGNTASVELLKKLNFQKANHIKNNIEICGEWKDDQIFVFKKNGSV